MINDNEIRLKGKLPFLRDNTVMGIGLSPVQSERLSNVFRWRDSKYVDIESALRSMSPVLTEYEFPGVSFDVSGIEVRSFISGFVKLPSDGPCLVRKDDSGIYCLPLGDEDIDALENSMHILARRVDEPTVMFKASLGKSPYTKKLLDSQSEDKVIPEPTLEPEPELDPKALEVIKAIDEIQKKYGITIEQLDALLSYKVKLSHLHITRTGRIILADFGGKEVKMDILSKALFFLYLKHPEGIRFKKLVDYRKELRTIYMGITGRDDLDEIEKSLDDLVDPLSNSVNVKSSRIKAAFRNLVADRVARFYYIDGPSGSAKKIQIDREYVIWE